MASSDAELNINLKADTSDATRSISKFSKTAQDQVSGIERSFSALKVVAGAAVAAFAGTAIISGINKAIDAAKIQEDAVNSLNTSLKLAGSFSVDASKDIQNFASQLQNVTTIGDETTLKLFALAKNFGLTNDQTKDLTKAAIELSAATGISLESAITNLGKSTGGLVGELGESIPALKGLSKEALESGAAIQFVLDRFGGAAASKLNTFSGATTALGNAFGDLQEVFGEIITNNDAVIAAINSTKNAFIDFGVVVGENQSGVSVFVTKTVEFLSGFAIFAAEIFQGVVDSITGFIIALKKSNIAIAEFQQKYLGADLKEFIARQQAAIDKNESFRDSVKKTTDSIIIRSAETIGAIKKIEKGIVKTKEETKKLGEESQKPLADVKKAVNETTDEWQKQLDLIRELPAAQRDAAFAAISELEKLRTAQDEYEKYLAEKEKADKEYLRNAQGDYEKFLKQKEKAEKAATTKNFFGDEINTDTLANINTGIGVAAGGLGNILNGADGAAPFVGSLGGAAADLFLPGSGQAVNQILQLLSGGPDQVKAQIEAFVEQLPIIIDAIVEAIPVVIEVLADNADKIVVAIANGLVRIGPAVADGIARAIKIFVVNAIREIGDVLSQVSLQGLTDGISSAFEGIETVFTDFAKSLYEIGDIFQIAGDAFNTFFENLQRFADSLSPKNLAESLTPGKNTVVGRIASGVGSFFSGFANGITEVPSGFSNDSFPARLSSGERVVDASTNQDLKSFLRSANQQSSNGGSQTMTVILQIGQEELARQILKLDKSNFQLRA